MWLGEKYIMDTNQTPFALAVMMTSEGKLGDVTSRTYARRLFARTLVVGSVLVRGGDL